jgi:maltooligosyltrehalose trehalohydrolase
MWFEHYHIDGLRIDAIHELVDKSAVHLLEQMSEEANDLEARLGRYLILIAESVLNDPKIIKPRELGGYGIDAQWCMDFQWSLHAVLTGENTRQYGDFGTLSDLCKSLQEAFVYDGRYSQHLRRRHGRPADGLSGHHFVTYLQNHDEVGNRMRGELISHLVNVGRAKVGAAIVFIAPMIPMLFQGEEWGASTPFFYFTSFVEPALAAHLIAGREQDYIEFGWDPSQAADPTQPETFKRSKLNWEELNQPPHSEYLDWYRQLIRLRRGPLNLMDGHMDWVTTYYNEKDCWLMVIRGPVTLICNLANNPQLLKIPKDQPDHILLASDPAITRSGRFLHLPADSVAILGPVIEEK